MDIDPNDPDFVKLDNGIDLLYSKMTPIFAKLKKLNKTKCKIVVNEWPLLKKIYKLYFDLDEYVENKLNIGDVS